MVWLMGRSDREYARPFTFPFHGDSKASTSFTPIRLRHKRSFKNGVMAKKRGEGVRKPLGREGRTDSSQCDSAERKGSDQICSSPRKEEPGQARPGEEEQKGP